LALGDRRSGARGLAKARNLPCRDVHGPATAMLPRRSRGAFARGSGGAGFFTALSAPCFRDIRFLLLGFVQGVQTRCTVLYLLRSFCAAMPFGPRPQMRWCSFRSYRSVRTFQEKSCQIKIRKRTQKKLQQKAASSIFSLGLLFQ